MERLLPPKLSIKYKPELKWETKICKFIGVKKRVGEGQNIWFPNPGISSSIKLSIFPRNAEQEHRLDKDVEKVHPREDAAKLQRFQLHRGNGVSTWRHYDATL